MNANNQQYPSQQPAAASITVVGLGSGDENQLTLGVLRRLETAGRLYLRTSQHPVVRFLEERGIRYESFDALYEEQASFGEVYEAITARLLEEAKSLKGAHAGTHGVASASVTSPAASPSAASPSAIVYAVPGHPYVAERTTQLLQSACAEAGMAFSVIGGESFLDQAFARFGFDPIEGLQLLDASSIDGRTLNPRLHTVIAQVYDVYTASDAKLALMERYPDDYPVVVGHALGVDGQERIERVPLFELDRVQGYGNLSLIWVPRTEEEAVLNRSFDRLHEIVRILRSPGGCPWDREQTHESIRKNLIEEAYEVIETIDEDDPDHMREELGDLMLQVMLHAQMEEETGLFTVYDVIEELNRKLIRRHPHVFGTTGAENADEALAKWNDVKAEEKRSKGINPEELSVLDGVPRELPGLMKAYKLQKKAAAVGFDWSTIAEVMAKVEEELAELKAEMAGSSSDPEARERQAGELGDLLFAVVNLARFLKTEPEEAIARTNRKFVSRFAHIEKRLREQGKAWADTSLEEMDRYWNEAKKS